jgi:transcriptional regulator with XRE-family HTH domain
LNSEPVYDEAETPQRAIGQRVRGYRKLQRRRLKELATLAGCSESLLSRVENGLVMPSLSTLHRLAKALGVNVAVLVETSKPESCTIFSPLTRPRTSIGGRPEGDGSTVESLVPYAENRQIEGLIVSLPVGGALNGPFSHQGEELGFVLEGELELVVDGVAHHVPAESSFFLQSDRPHSYRNVGSTTCRVVWVNTPPTF